MGVIRRRGKDTVAWVADYDFAKKNTLFFKNIAFYFPCHFANQSVDKFLDVGSFLTSFNVAYGYCRLLICFGLN